MERMEKSDWGHGKIFQIDPPRQCCMEAAQIHLYSAIIRGSKHSCKKVLQWLILQFWHISADLLSFLLLPLLQSSRSAPGFSLLPTYSGVYWGASNATPVLFFSSRPSWFEKSASWTRLRSFSPAPSLSSPFCQATADTSSPCITRAQFWPTTMQVGAWWRKTSGERCTGKEFKRQ